MRKRTAVRIIGGAVIATAAMVNVMTRTNPARTAGGAPMMQRDMLITKPVPPVTGTAPIAKAARVTLQMRNPSVNTRGIARIVNTGIRSPTVAQRVGIVPSAKTKTRYMRLRMKRIATIRGTA